MVKLDEMTEEEAWKIYEAVRKEAYPPTNVILLSRAQYTLAKLGKIKPASCIAQWIVQLEGGHISYEDWKKLCEIEE